MTIANYVDGVYDSDFPDEDLIQTTSYNKGGQVTATSDVRGTQTAFAYDAAGRQREVTHEAGSAQASSDYICYDKAGRRLRAIQHYRPEPTDPSPDARDAQGDWLFAPPTHGLLDDANRVTTFTLDKLGRVLATSDPLGNGQGTAYAPDGAVQAVTDPEGVAAQYRDDRLGRRALVVQGYTPAATDPAQWVWDATDGRWEDQ
jgi:YD repeat-containing protein